MLQRPQQSMRRTAFLADTTALILFFTTTGIINERFIAGMAWVGTLTSLNVAMQLRSPDAILGRCLSIYQAVTFGSMALGAWTWGTLSDRLGVPGTLYAAAGFLAAMLVILRLFAPMPRVGEGVQPA